tara:strand:+ start:208035 stop:208745 length:711 start_codon:yes stop_codon:yes gene_type:complete
MSEKQTQDTQLAFLQTDPANEPTRYLENKPAMLVVTDEANNILLSLVGMTKWDLAYMDNDEFAIQSRYFRHDAGNIESYHTDLDALRNLCPTVPAFRFTPAEQFTADIRNTGTATKAYLIVDTHATRSTADISTWEVELWDGTAPFDVAALPEEIKHLQLGIGDTTTNQPVRLTSTAVDKSESVVQLADGYINMFFMNMYHDWSTMRDAMEARLAAMPSFGKSLQEIADKEAIAFA